MACEIDEACRVDLPSRVNPHSTGPILIADDDPVLVLLAKASIQQAGVANEIVTAADGAEAIRFFELAVVGGAGDIPVLAVLDMEMPGATGLEVAAWMRSEPATRHVPIVLLTGSTAPEVIAAADALGIDAYLVKPVGVSALHDVLDELPLRRLLVAGPGR